MFCATVLGVALTASLSCPSLHRGATPHAWRRCAIARLLDKGDAPDNEEDTGGDPWDSSLAVLSRRLGEVRDAERDEEVQNLIAASNNWKVGRCAQRTLVILDEWVRRIHCADGLLACGTYSGEVVLVDIGTGDILETWPAGDEQPLGDFGVMADLVDDPDEEPVEITAVAIAKDGTHVVSGDAAGAVVLRRRGREEPLVAARHRKSVTGVHAVLEDNRMFSASLDATLRCHDSETGSMVGSLSLKAPVIAMSVCEKYCALGLADGTVSICTLSDAPAQILSFRAHTDAASAVHLLSGSSLVTGCADGSVCLWRLDEEGDSERRCTRFEGHSAPVRVQPRCKLCTQWPLHTAAHVVQTLALQHPRYTCTCTCTCTCCCERRVRCTSLCARVCARAGGLLTGRRGEGGERCA